MSNYQFKAGDKVYFPKMSSKIYTLQQSSNKAYPLIIKYNDVNFDEFTLHGNLHSSDANPSLLLATDENRFLLNQLYDDEFEESKPINDFIQEQIDKNSYCLCVVSDYEINKGTNIKTLEEWVVPIISLNTSSPYLYEGSAGNSWKYAEPIQINSDGSITYLFEG